MLRKTTCLLLISLSAMSQLKSQATIQIGSSTLEVDTIITGLDVPWEIVYGPDAHLWMTERKGLVSRLNVNTGVKTILLNLVGHVYQVSEAGLLGLALHPDFNLTPEVFIAYTYRENGMTFERLVKYSYSQDSLLNPDTLINGIPGNSTHDGCRLLFMPDGTLLMTTGDAQNQNSPQNLNSLNGKVLRLNTDGSIPSDNPDSNSYVYSFGHRNAQGLCAGPAGKFYLSEHGPNSDDEFMILEKNRNYGWPQVKGYCNLPDEITFCNANHVLEPLLAWTPTIAPSDMLYYQNPSFPEWHGCILMTVLKDKKLIALRLNNSGDSVIAQTHYLGNLFGRLRDIAVSPEGDLFLATNGASWANTDPNTHSIIRLRLQQPSSVSNTEQQVPFSIYPNPSSGYLFINTTIPLKAIKVYNVLQEEVYRFDDKENFEEGLDLSFLSSGIYYLQIQWGEIISYQKIGIE